VTPPPPLLVARATAGHAGGLQGGSGQPPAAPSMAPKYTYQPIIFHWGLVDQIILLHQWRQELPAPGGPRRRPSARSAALAAGCELAARLVLWGSAVVAAELAPDTVAAMYCDVYCCRAPTAFFCCCRDWLRRRGCMGVVCAVFQVPSAEGEESVSWSQVCLSRVQRRDIVTHRGVP